MTDKLSDKYRDGRVVRFDSDYMTDDFLNHYNRFNKWYLVENADKFSKEDWDNISAFANLNLEFINRFLDKLCPTMLFNNSYLNPSSYEFIKNKTNGCGSYSIENEFRGVYYVRFGEVREFKKSYYL